MIEGIQEVISENADGIELSINYYRSNNEMDIVADKDEEQEGCVMKCMNCGFESDGRFCPECGTPLEEMNVSTEKSCPACGQMTDTKFCPNCGHNMNEGPENLVHDDPAFADAGGTLFVKQKPEHDGDIRWSGASMGAPTESLMGAPKSAPKKSYRKVIMVIVIAVAAVLVAAIIAFTVIVRGFMDNEAVWESDNNVGVTTSEDVDIDDTDSELVA